MSDLRLFLTFFLSALPMGSLCAQPGSELLGTWRSTEPGDSQEVLTFESGGTLRVDRTTVRYEVDGKKLRLVGDSGTVHGTWRVASGELIVTLELEEQGKHTARYRKDDPTLRVGRVSFTAPAAWTVARETEAGALLNPGFAPTDTLDALILVVHGHRHDRERGLGVTELVRGRLAELASELRKQAISIDLAAASMRLAKTAAGDGIVLESEGLANGDRKVSVWLGATSDTTGFAAVIGVLVSERVREFVPKLERLHASMRLQSPSVVVHPLAGAEFGRATFGSGGNSLTTTYAFLGDGSVVRRTMFSSSIGGSDRSERGTWTLAGEALQMRFSGETTSARIVVESDRIVALRIGAARYPRE